MHRDIPSRWLTPEQAADVSGFSTKTIYRALWAGELVAAKRRRRWRIRSAALDAWVDGERAGDPATTSSTRRRVAPKRGGLGKMLDARAEDAA